MGKKRKQRRQSRGSASHWKYTDCWYYTPPGTKKRMSLFDEEGRRIRGKENRQAAELALTRVKMAGNGRPTPEPARQREWLVARACSQYVAYCRHGAAGGTT